jgi:hypothetical protein
VVAFAGGVLSLLAPCRALLLPAFFAYAFTSRTELLGRTVLFLAGLCTVFIPLGLGASLVAALLLDYRDTTILVAGVMLIGFGVLEILGVGFSLIPSGLAGRIQGGRSATGAYLTGFVYGISGFCAGPLLGAVLTIASSPPIRSWAAHCCSRTRSEQQHRSSSSRGSGIAMSSAHGAWLRGRPIHLGPLQTHSISVLAGALFVAFGTSFIAFQGASVLSGAYASLGLEELSFRLQTQLQGVVGRSR